METNLHVEKLNLFLSPFSASLKPNFQHHIPQRNATYRSVPHHTILQRNATQARTKKLCKH